MGNLRASLAVIALILCGAVSGCSGGGDGAGEPSLEDIGFFMPSHLPSGWKLGHATQRIEIVPGPNASDLRISDYTVVWRPERFVGTAREDSTDQDNAVPSLGLNAGSVYYGEYYSELVGGESPDQLGLGEVEVTSVDGHLGLSFKLGCCLVSLTSDGVDEDDLRAIAESLTEMSYDEWRASLGDRLLVDDQTT